MSETKQLFPSRGNLLLAAVVTFGIVLPGMARRLLGEADHDDLGMIVFTFGYVDVVVIVWYGWVRPLGITGPAE